MRVKEIDIVTGSFYLFSDFVVIFVTKKIVVLFEFIIVLFPFFLSKTVVATCVCL